MKPNSTECCERCKLIKRYKPFEKKICINVDCLCHQSKEKCEKCNRELEESRNVSDFFCTGCGNFPVRCKCEPIQVDIQDSLQDEELLQKIALLEKDIETLKKLPRSQKSGKYLQKWLLR